MKNYKIDEVGRTALSNFTTAELVHELMERDGVQHLEVEPYTPVAIVVDGKSVSEIDSGPCHILVVYD